MTLKTSEHSYIYAFNSDYHYSELCLLESRQIFDQEPEHKMLFSNLKIDPSISPFIRCRFEIILSAESYPELLKNIKEKNIHMEEFKVEYLTLDGDSSEYSERLEKLRDVGYSIEGESEYYTPAIIYSICVYQNIWYFGVLNKNNPEWRKHDKKPCSFSNSISMKIAKTLVSISAKGNKTKQLLDACCGVGTTLLEACYAGFNIEGCDINWKACRHARKNLAHYNYTANVFCSDIKDLDKKYDAAIIDLPYNLYSYSDESITLNIIESTAKLTARIVIVSISDIKPIIKKTGLKIIDFCNVEKRGKSGFTRIIWVCEKKDSSN